MAIFKGAGVAIVTPMNEDGSVNYEKFGELIEFQIANGTDAIIVCGTTGESSTLTHEEHLDTIKYCVDKVAKRIPVVAGTGSNCTETAVYLSQEAEKYGVDGILLVSPYYNKATQKGLYRHFKTVADSVKVPAILYNVPSRTGCNILPETVVISISDDGTHFTELRKQHFEVSKETPIRFTDISWQGEAKGRYVRYQAQAGSEFGGWIFTDEIIVK